VHDKYMDKEFEQFLKGIKDIKLSQKEKELSRTRVVDFMKQHPIKTIATRKQNRARFFETERTLFVSIGKKHILMPLTLIIAILLGGSVSYAAEGAFPGDTLYPIKITVNEGVQNLLAVSAESKAKLQVELANERLKEAEVLVINNRLNAQTQAKVEAQFQSHAEKVQKLVEKIEKEEKGDHRGARVAAEVHANLESVLNAHEDVLVRIKDTSEREDETRALASLILNVRAQGEIASSTNVKFDAAFTTQTDERMQKGAREKKKSAQNKIEEVKKYISKMEARISAEASAQANTRIVSASEAVVAGDVYMDGKMYRDAFNSYQTAVKIAQEAKLIIEIEKDLKVSNKNKSKVKESEQNDRDSNGGKSNRDERNEEDDDRKSDVQIRTNQNGTTTTGTNLKIQVKTGTSTESHTDDDEEDDDKEDGDEVETEIKVNVGGNSNLNVTGGVQ